MRWFGYRTRVVIEPSVPIFDTDARRHGGPRPRGEVDPESEAAQRMRRRVRIVAWNVIFCAGALAAVVGRGGYLDLMRYRAERDDALARLAEQRQSVAAEREAIERLRVDPLAKERIAREQLGLAPPGEIQFLLPREDAGGGVRPTKP